MEDEKCKVHDKPLIPMKVSVSYGLPYFDKEEVEARRNLFPNAKSFVLGGCDVEAPRKADVLVCEDCREAEIEWKKAKGRYISEKIGDVRI